MLMQSHKPKLYWIPVFIWMILIYLLSSRQSITIADQHLVNFLIFKSLHIIEYAVLYILSVLALKKNSSPYYLIYAIYITIAFALTDEIHQMAVPTREGVFRDVIIDSIGVILGSIFFTTFKKSWKL